MIRQPYYQWTHWFIAKTLSKNNQDKVQVNHAHDTSVQTRFTNWFLVEAVVRRQSHNNYNRIFYYLLPTFTPSDYILNIVSISLAYSHIYIVLECDIFIVGLELDYHCLNRFTQKHIRRISLADSIHNIHNNVISYT